MKFVSVRDLKNQPGAVWESLKDGEDIVVTSNGKPFALLVETDEASLEQQLKEMRFAKARLALSRLRKQAQEAGLDKLTSDEIDELIARTRKKRREGRS